MMGFLESLGADFLAGHDGCGERVLVQMRKAQGIKYWKPVAETKKHQYKQHGHSVAETLSN